MYQLRRGITANPSAYCPSGGASYTGPGDVVSGATAFWGLRAYSNATIGSNCVELRRGGDNVTQTFQTIAGGGLDTSAISTFSTAGSGNGTLFVRTLYDQVGSANLLETTLANQPIFTLNGLGSLPIISTLISNSRTLSATLAGSLTQPYTYSAVSKRTADFTTLGFVGGCISPVAMWYYNNATNTLALNAGSIVTTTVSDSAFHALNLVFSGGSSDMNIDGTQNTKNAGTNASGTSVGFFGVPGQGNASMDGVEQGLWNIAFTPTQSSNMSSNQHAFWGF